MFSSYTIQNRCHNHIESFFTGVLFSKIQRYILYGMDTKSICMRYSPTVLSSYRSFRRSVPFQPLYTSITIDIDTYTYGHPAILELRAFLSRELKSFLKAAIIHGSFGTNEAIPYSDIDVLLVFSDNVFANSSRLAHVCSRTLAAMRIMLKHDPLQHHGFFILTEADTESYCESYFPSVLFLHGKSLFEDQGTRLVLKCRDSTSEALASFMGMISAIRRKAVCGELPTHYYGLKLLLSQIMLLPALYLQARGQYVFKRDSFPIAKENFSSAAWEIIDIASEIRLNWDYTPSFGTRAVYSMFRNPFIDMLYQIRFGQPLSASMKRYLSPRFFSQTLRLIHSMEEKICEHHRLAIIR